jgi:hypothetical protein
MLLTVGAAVPSSAIDAPAQLAADIPRAEAVASEALTAEVTPEMIAQWRTTAVSRDYVASKRPI